VSVEIDFFVRVSFRIEVSHRESNPRNDSERLFGFSTESKEMQTQ